MFSSSSSSGGGGAGADVDTERWVQCTRCAKWRRVADALVVRAGWHCRLNVFSPSHRTCDAPQEPMPDEEDGDGNGGGGGDATDPMALLAGILGDADPVDETASADMLFTRSTCPCDTCTSMNAAVDGWAAHDASALPPLLQCVVRAIDKSAPRAEALEAEKRFLFRPDGDEDGDKKT